VAEGTIVRWTKKVAENVKEDEVLLEVETDKTTVEVESPAAGRLSACLKHEGEIAAAGEVIGLIEAEGDVLPKVHKPGANTPHAKGRENEPLLVSRSGEGRTSAMTRPCRKSTVTVFLRTSYDWRCSTMFRFANLNPSRARAARAA
jgi:pyruvate/2-oxoglutarate dehydrogenase complex dihydrolipoamide acyltransferase (E2) component